MILKFKKLPLWVSCLSVVEILFIDVEKVPCVCFGLSLDNKLVTGVFLVVVVVDCVSVVCFCVERVVNSFWVLVV